MTIVYERAVALLEAELGDELVALEANQGICFGFNGVAADVWRELVSPKTLDQIQAAIFESYDVDPQECRGELIELLIDLTNKGLIRVSTPN